MIATAKTKNRYVDSYCNNPDQLNLSAQEMLKPAVEVISYPSEFISKVSVKSSQPSLS